MPAAGADTTLVHWFEMSARLERVEYSNTFRLKYGAQKV